MRRLLCLTPLAVVLVVLGLAVGVPRAGAIIGGQPDTTRTNVGIMYLDWPYLTGFCSGSLIAPHEFLVAGHCTHVLDADPELLASVHVTFEQSVSLDPLSFVISSNDPITVTDWTTHPDWSIEHNDVGVLHLDPSVDLGLTPVSVAAPGFLDKKNLAGHTFTESGYGLNGTDRFFWSPQADLTWDQQREYGPAQFRSLTQDRLHVVGGGCGGDSGGPYFYTDNPNSVIVAVDSTGAGSCVGPGEVQRLDTESVHQFLEDFTD